MKLFQSFIAALILAVMPLTAFAQLTVPQGGTGQTSFTADQILYGVSSLRLGSEAAFTYDPDTNTLTAGTGAFTSLSVGSVSNTELGYLDGVTSAIQTQLNAKQATLGNDSITADMLVSTGQTDEYCLSYEATGDTLEWKDCSAGSGDNVSVDGGAVVDPDFVSTGDIDFVNTTNTITANINTGAIVNADVNASAAIAYSKLNLAGGIIETDLDADVAATDGDFLQYDSTGTNFTWRSAAETASDLGLVIGTNVQAYDADLTTYAGIAPSANVQSLLGAADYAAMRTQLGLVIGTNVQAYDADLTTYAGITPSANTQTFLGAADYAAMRTQLSLGSLALLNTINNGNWSGTDLSVANGGTGVSTLTDGGVLIGNGTGALVATAVLTNGQLLIGDGTTDPTVATLTQGTGMTITNGAGSITLATTLGTSIAAAEIDNDTITHAQIDDSDQASTMCVYIEDPTDADDLKSIWANKTANDFLLTELWAESDQTVALDLQVDDGTPADVNGTDITPAAGEAEDTSLSGDTTVAAGEELDLAITSVAGTPTWVSICWTGNWVD